MTRLSLLYPVSTALFLLFLGGCSALPAEQSGDPRLDQLLAGMDQCVAAQSESNERLAQQSQQLAQQQQQLEVLAQDLANARAITPESGRTAAAVACPQPEEISRKLLVGELEQVWLPNLKLALPARIDTGAETASIDARNIELFERNGRRWVRFEIVNPESGEPLALERKLKRMVRILQSNTAESERRPVIRLGVTIGHIHQTAEFTLSNRSHLDSQLLIGRNILQDVMIVDVGKKNIAPYVLYGDSGNSTGARQ